MIRSFKVIKSEEVKPAAQESTVSPSSVAETPTVRLPEISAKFVFAGRAIFVTENAAGEHITYRVRGHESEFPLGSGIMRKSYFLNIKSPGGKRFADGSQSPWRYIGVIGLDGNVKLTNKSEYQPTSREVKVAAWSLRAIMDGKPLPEGYRIRHSGKCGRCGRELTDPESMTRGIGPECWSLMGN